MLSGFQAFLTFLFFLSISFLFLSVKVVPQSKVYVIERFGKYTKTLESGLSIIIPFLDRVAHKVDILERQLPKFQISVITKDNVEVGLVSTVFFRILDASKSVYRIKNIDSAIENTAISVIRSAAGKLELDDLQSSRESMNLEIKDKQRIAIIGNEGAHEITTIVFHVLNKVGKLYDFILSPKIAKAFVIWSSLLVEITSSTPPS